MTTRKLLESAYLAGFRAAGEGWNGEYPFQDNGRDPVEDSYWSQKREEYVSAMLEAMEGGLNAEPPAG